MGRFSEPQYDKFILKEYSHWTLFLHDNQSYLGRAYVWLARESRREKLSAISIDERDELWIILSNYEKALDAIWGPAHMNYAWLGNLFAEHGGHGHMHIIPRYAVGPIQFNGELFVDQDWGKMYDSARKWKAKNANTIPNMITALQFRLTEIQ